MLKTKIAKVEVDLHNTMKAMQNVREQIVIFNKKGEELAAHANFLRGKIEALKELERDSDTSTDIKADENEITGDENV
jgi:hypothetical protein